MLMVLFQNIHAFNCRSETTSAFRIPLSRNYILIFGILGAQGLHVAATYNPFLQRALNLSPIPLRQWLLLLAISSSVLWVMELFKWMERRRTKAASAPAR